MPMPIRSNIVAQGCKLNFKLKHNIAKQLAKRTLNIKKDFLLKAQNKIKEFIVRKSAALTTA
jgi:uncharacterized protein YajQ (UPF0234 family)